MKTRLVPLSYLVLLRLFELLIHAQAPTPSALPKLTTATCGKPACTWNAFGPTTYTRQTGQPQTVGNAFSVLDPNTQFTRHVDNHGVSLKSLHHNLQLRAGLRDVLALAQLERPEKLRAKLDWLDAHPQWRAKLRGLTAMEFRYRFQGVPTS